MDIVKKKLSDIIAPAFFPVHRDVYHHNHTHYVLAGGRGSTKSSYVSIEILLTLYRNPDVHAVILRKVGNTLRNSVYPQMEWALDQLGALNDWKLTISPMCFTRVNPDSNGKGVGQKILFFGVDDKAKIKSIKLPYGYVGIVWYEELDQFNGMEEIRNLNQSLMRGGNKFWCFSSYNPPKSAQNWVNSEMLFDEKDRIVHQSNYLDVNPDWLGDQFIEEAEKLKRRNEMAYRHEYLGEITGTGGAVFDNVHDINLTAEDISNFDTVYNGLDFGFTIDPLAFVRCYYDRKHEDLYIFDEIYEHRLTNPQAAKRIEPKISVNEVVWCDSAEPKSIAEIRTYNINAFGAKKTHDSIQYGLKWLQDRAHIYIDKKRCPNAYKDFVSYEYEQNRNGEYISAYPDRNNHTLDATRYALWRVMKSPGLKIIK